MVLILVLFQYHSAQGESWVVPREGGVSMDTGPSGWWHLPRRRSWVPGWACGEHGVHEMSWSLRQGRARRGAAEAEGRLPTPGPCKGLEPRRHFRGWSARRLA